jgi:hypothetical protein|nr:MAG TPA: hypothetical protein [Bacteriophage sp.]
MSRGIYDGYIAGSLCKGIRRDNRAPVFASTSKKLGCVGCFDFVMSHYADEVARMRAGARRGDA